MHRDKVGPLVKKITLSFAVVWQQNKEEIIVSNFVYVYHTKHVEWQSLSAQWCRETNLCYVVCVTVYYAFGTKIKSQ